MGTTPGGLPFPDPTAKVANVDLAIRQLAEALDPAAPLTPSLLNSWVATGGGDHPVRVYRSGSWVHIAGTIKSGVLGSAAFVLPVGWRPAGNLNISNMANSALGRLIITSAGNVTPQSGSNVWWALDATFIAVPA